MRFSFAPSPPPLFVACVLLLVGLCIFVRNLVKRDIQYESLCPWWVRLFIYSITLVFVPPMGLSTGLGLFVFGKNRELRRFAKGAVFVSLISLTFHMAIYLDQNSRQTDFRSQPRSWSSHDFPSITAELKEYGILVVGPIIPYNNLIPDSHLSWVGTIKPMPERA